MNPEKVFFTRALHLVAEYGQVAVRTYFDATIPPAKLKSVLENCKTKLEQSMSKGEIKRLFTGDAAIPNITSKDFDMGAMVTILRNSGEVRAKKSDWDNVQNVPHNVSEDVKAVAMIKHYRNKISHVHDLKLSESEYNGLFMDVLNAINQLGGPNLYNSAKTLREASLDSKEDTRNVELISIVNRLYEKVEILESSINDSRKGIFDPRAEIVETSKKILKTPGIGRKFVQTRAFNDGKKLLMKEGILIFLGGPGDGKTTNAEAIMSDIVKEEDCEAMILHAKDLTNWKILIRSERTNYIFLDDILRSASEKNFPDELRQFFNYAMNIIGTKAGSVKVIMCIRKKVYSECSDITEKYEIFRQKYCIDLTNEQYSLTVEEKESILRKHLENSVDIPITITSDLERENILKDDILSEGSKVLIGNWTLRKIATESKELEGYPESCTQFASNRHLLRQGKAFFSYPKKNLIETLDGLRDNKEQRVDCFRDKLKYCTLVYVMFNNNTLHRDKIDLDSFQTIARSLGLVHELRDVSCQTIALAAQEMESIYLSGSKHGQYTFRHDTIAEAVIFSYGVVCQKEIIERCDYRILFEVVRTEAYKHDSHEICLTVRSSFYQNLAQRFLKEIRKNNGLTVAGHAAMDDDKFIDAFMQEMDLENTEKEFVSENGEKIHETLFTGACYFRRHLFAERLLNNVSIPISLSLFALVYACHNGSIDHAQSCFEFLSKKVEQGVLKNVYLKGLFAACETGQEEIINLILRKLENPNSEEFIEAFHTACSHGKVNIAELLRTYTQEKQPCLSQEHLGRALVAASSKGYLATVEWLMRENSEIDEEYIKKALKRACMFGYINVAERIIGLSSDNEPLCQCLTNLYEIGKQYDVVAY